MKKISILRWNNVIIITFILFGEAIYTSSRSLYERVNNSSSQDLLLDFSTSSNYEALIIQTLLLILAFLYLKYLNFNFSVWKIKISTKATMKGIFLFVLVAFMSDIYYAFVNYLFPEFSESVPQIISKIDLSLFLYALLNGFYEEIFFLGICLSVDEKNRFKYFLYSILIRFSFHTYQGIEAAIGIGIIMGGIYFFIYSKSKDKNLFPYFLSHAIADVLGMSLFLPPFFS